MVSRRPTPHPRPTKLVWEVFEEDGYRVHPCESGFVVGVGDHLSVLKKLTGRVGSAWTPEHSINAAIIPMT